MKRKDLPKRYLVFAFGLLFNAFGAAFVTKATLGASPITSIAYSLSLILPRLTIGNWSILFSLLLIALQIVLLKREANKAELLMQVVISFTFGYLIDFSMFVLTAFHPRMYAAKLGALAVGCVIIAFGAYLEVIADVAMLPGDAFVRAVQKVSHMEYGKIRVISDVSMSTIAGVLCLIFLHELSGVREGTFLIALGAGNLLRLFMKWFEKLTYAIFPADQAAPAEKRE